MHTLRKVKDKLNIHHSRNKHFYTSIAAYEISMIFIWCHTHTHAHTLLLHAVELNQIRGERALAWMTDSWVQIDFCRSLETFSCSDGWFDSSAELWRLGSCSNKAKVRVMVLGENIPKKGFLNQTLNPRPSNLKIRTVFQVNTVWSHSMHLDFNCCCQI